MSTPKPSAREPSPIRIPISPADEATLTAITVVRPENIKTLATRAEDKGTTRTTATFGHLKGSEKPDEIARLLQGWHPAVTTDQVMPRYALIGKLGSGSQGVVYRIIDRDCRREVAFKTVKASNAAAHELSRFVHEAQITAQLEHPGIVPIHDFGVLPDGTVFYTMKKVAGETLSDWLKDRRGQESHRFDMLQVLLRVCEAVSFANNHGVIHRDIKPRNIMIGTYGEVLVMDWGLAKVVGSDDASTTVSSVRSDHEPEGDIHRTLVGFAVGTPAYMSPEAARGELHSMDSRSDVYSLGVILYEILAGESPYIRGDVQRTIEQAATGTYKRLDEHILGDGGRALGAIVRKAMAQKVVDRYSDVDQFMRDIRNFLAGRAVSAHHETFSESCVRLYRRHRRPILSALAATLAIGIPLCGWIGWSSLREDWLMADWQAEAAHSESIGDYDHARARYEQILAITPGNRQVQFARTSVSDKIQAAIQADEIARARDAALALTERAAVLSNSATIDSLRQAAELYLQALGLRPTDESISAAYRATTQKLATLEETQKAESVTTERKIQARELMAKARAAQAQLQLQEAISLAEASLHLDPSDDTRVFLRDLDLAFTQFEAERKLAIRRSEADALINDVETALQDHRVEFAKQALEQIRGIDATNPKLPALDVAVQQAIIAVRQQQADALLTQAATLTNEAHNLQRDIEDLTLLVRRQQAELLEHGNADARGILHGLEVRLADHTQSLSASLAQAVGLLHQARQVAPDYPAVTTALTNYFIDRMLDAERSGDTARAEAAEAQARAFDDGSRERLLRGVSHIEITNDAESYRILRLMPGPDRSDQPTGDPQRLLPGQGLDVHIGRYLFLADSGMRFSRRLSRDDVVRIPRMPGYRSAPDSVVFIPSGTVYTDEGRAGDTIPAFGISRYEITAAEYLEFLNDPQSRLIMSDRLQKGFLVYAPREGLQATEPLWQSRGVLTRKQVGTFSLALQDGTELNPQQPITHISYEDALAYAAWRAAKESVAWRLPSRLEWTLAAQGGDGRAYTWGNNADPGLCYSYISSIRPGVARTLLTVGSFPTDQSVQGVFDLAGSLSEFVLDTAGDASLGVLMGGNRSDRQADRFSTWSRREMLRQLPSANCGIRLACDLP